MSQSTVQNYHPAVQKLIKTWKLIRAACEGESSVKALRSEILPIPNATDTSEENKARYEAYLGRAVYYNVTGRTLEGMVGYVFTTEPTVKLPQEIEGLIKNVDGGGVSLVQQAKRALSLTMALGRCGLLVDYPKVAKQATTRKELLDGTVSPVILLYDAESIVNWKTETVGSQTRLKLLVLCEAYSAPLDNDEFTHEYQKQYRVLTLDADGVTGRIFRSNGKSEDYVEDTTLRYQPLDKAGKRLTQIPFVFIGSLNNDDSVDEPPLLDLALLNLAHFRNSADYEEASFFLGQPTAWISGLSQNWVDKVMKGQVFLGSRSVIPLPAGASAGILQVSPNTLPKEAMDHKEHQMVALGAKLVQQQEVERTATEVGLENSAEVSVLVSSSKNVFLGYTKAIEFCGMFTGAGEAKVTFELSEPLTQKTLKPEEATALMGLWTGGLLDFEEARKFLKKSGIAFKDDTVVKENVDSSLSLPKPTAKPPAVA